jgi:hypothetical protein
MRSRHVVRAAASLALTAALASCSSSSTPAASPSSSSAVGGMSGAPQPTSSKSPMTSAASAPAVEVHPPGDIPDNQAFVPFSGQGFRATVPEGWARSTSRGTVVFTDKYNSITFATTSASSAPTVQSATSTEVPTIKRSSHGFVAGTVTTVGRPAGQAVLITYRALSPVNPVTGKVATEAVERYEFWRKGREVIVTLAAPVGSDNVDPWRKITDSFTWTRT